MFELVVIFLYVYYPKIKIPDMHFYLRHRSQERSNTGVRAEEP